MGLIDSIPDYEAPVAEVCQCLGFDTMTNSNSTTMITMINQASDSDSEEEVPPPLPPPRTESLKKEVIVVYNISLLLRAMH